MAWGKGLSRGFLMNHMSGPFLAVWAFKKKKKFVVYLCFVVKIVLYY